MTTYRTSTVIGRKQLFLAQAKAKYGDTFNYSKVNYINNNTAVEIECPIHGYFSQRPANHLTCKTGCYSCGKTHAGKVHRITQTDFVAEATRIHKDRYDYSKTEYIGAFIPIVITCPVHGDFNKQPNDHVYHRSGCPACVNKANVSKGEEAISDVLDMFNISYHGQYQFAGLVGRKGHPLRVDFYLPSHNTIIEFDGPHHLKPIRYKGTSMAEAEHTHILTSEYDDLKNTVAQKEGIRMIRIPYTQLRNIDQILSNALALTTSRVSSINS